MSIAQPSTVVQINHDLKLLYTIARTIFPKDILAALLYGEGFDEPNKEELSDIRQLASANRGRIELESEDDRRGKEISLEER